MVVQGRRVALRSGCVVAWLSACAGTGLDGGTDGSSSETGGTADSSGGAGTVATTVGGETTVGSVDGSGDSSGAGASSESSSGAAASSEGTTGEPFPEPVPDDCITDVTAGHHAFVCDGLTYDVEVPAACLLAPCGMIVDVHGLAMSAQMQDSNTNMRALGQRYGYIVVQPNADPAPPLSNWIPGIDDPKVFDFMQRTAAAWHVDADRWHFTGFSQGGFMTWRFACAHADVLASVAPGAACGNDFPIEDCQFTDDESPSRVRKNAKRSSGHPAPCPCPCPCPCPAVLDHLCSARTMLVSMETRRSRRSRPGSHCARVASSSRTTTSSTAAHSVPERRAIR